MTGPALSYVAASSFREALRLARGLSVRTRAATPPPDSLPADGRYLLSPAGTAGVAYGPTGRTLAWFDVSGVPGTRRAMERLAEGAS